MRSKKHNVKLVLLVAVSQTLLACSAAQVASTIEKPPVSEKTMHEETSSLHPDSWISEHIVDHPLVGTVWFGDGTRAGWSALSNAVSEADFTLVGEIHTNPDHHLLQSKIIDTIAVGGKKPVVVWEMIPAKNQAILDSLDLTTPESASTLGATLDWDNSGWPSWSMYEPIAVTAVEHKLPMRGAALERTFLRELATNGTDELSPELMTRLHLDEPLDQAASESMLDLLYEGHCELISRAALKPMQSAQRARDGAMADAMLSNPDSSQGAVLIAGNGHVRNDWGVSAVLEKSLKTHSPNATVLSIAQIEVSEKHKQISGYTDFQSDPPIYDFIVFTPQSEIKDHCAELQKRFGS
ncbi:MAG: ChaN family lipoprotein [Granulosicoccus sp.]